MANNGNLMPIEEVNSNRTREQHSEDSRKGGIASGKARREKATMLSTLRKLLDEEYKDTGMTYREMATLGLIKGAVKGNPLNYKTMIEVLGETKGNDTTNGILGELVEAMKNAKDNK